MLGLEAISQAAISDLGAAPVSGTTLSFAIADALDSGAFALGVTGTKSISLSASDAHDLAAFVLGFHTSVHLVASDARDSAVFTLRDHNSSPVPPGPTIGPNPTPYQPGFPEDAQMVDENGHVREAWRYFFMALWTKTGGSIPQ